MKQRQHTPEQVIRKLAEGEKLLAEGKTIEELSRHLEVSEQTWHRWRNQFGGMKADDAKRLKELEKENARLNKLLAEAELDKSMLKEAYRKLWPAGVASFESRARTACRARLKLVASRNRWKYQLADNNAPSSSKASWHGSQSARSSPLARASSAARSRVDIHCRWHSEIRSRAGLGSLAANSAMAEAKKQPPGNTSLST